MNTLIDTTQGLNAALVQDPLLLLASTVATFDPYWAAGGDVDDESDPIALALCIVRGVFPDIYADALEHLRRGAAYAEMDRRLCAAFCAKGIALEDIEMIGWGVPMNAVGVELDNPDFYATHPELLPVLAPFGVAWPDDDAEYVTVPEQAYTVGRIIAASLHEQTDPALQQIGWLFGWLFSCTGNSLVDWTEEILGEMEPLSWSKEDVAFALEIIREADEIMAESQAGIALLQTATAFFTQLERNIQLIEQAYRKGKRNGQPTALEWTGADLRVDGTTHADTQFLLVRRDAA